MWRDGLETGRGNQIGRSTKGCEVAGRVCLCMNLSYFSLCTCVQCSRQVIVVHTHTDIATVDVYITVCTCTGCIYHSVCMYRVYISQCVHVHVPDRAMS